MSDDGTHTHHPCCTSHGVNMSCERYRQTHFIEVRPCCADDQRILTGPLTHSEWRNFQAIPDQGYSHRHWVDEKIAQRVTAALTAEHARVADDETVERARIAIHRALAPIWAPLVGIFDGGQHRYDDLIDDLARAALRATTPPEPTT